jgi:cytochrome c-type biogenesis protein
MPFDLPAILVAGLLTFLSPCILPLVPLYLSVLAGASAAELKAGRRGTGTLVLTAVCFSLGLGVVFVGLGLAATSLGNALVQHRTLLMQLGGVLIFLFGLKFLGVLRVPFLERDARPWLGRLTPSGSLLGALAFGAAFALGWTPCVGPVLGSVLTFTATTAASPAQGALYLGTYALGLSLPLIGVAAAAPWALRSLERVRPHLRRIEVATGVLLLAMGLLLITDKLDQITADLSTKVAAAKPPPPAPGAACALDDDDSSASCAGPASTAAATLELPASIPPGQAMVEFVSRSCPACQRMAPVVAAAEHDCEGRDVTVARVDVGEPSGSALARAWAIRGVPTFVFLDQGREIARLVGEQPPSALEHSLELLTGRRCEGPGALPPG